MFDVSVKPGWNVVVPVTGGMERPEIYKAAFETLMLVPDAVPLDVNRVTFTITLVTGTTLVCSTYVRSNLTFNYAEVCQRLAQHLSKRANSLGQPAVQYVTHSVEPIVPSIVVMDVSGGVRYDHK